MSELSYIWTRCPTQFKTLSPHLLLQYQQQQKNDDENKTREEGKGAGGNSNFSKFSNHWNTYNALEAEH